MNQPQKVQLTTQQIAQAAASTQKLLNDDARVNIPPSMAMSGDLVVINAVLGALVRGEVVVAAPEQMKEGELQKVEVPAQEGTDASAAA